MEGQSEEDRKARTMQQQVSELEALVSMACSKGADPGRCREIIEDAVRRARRKGAMLPHLDSSLLLSTLEQAKGEIASLSDVTATNAEVMQQELLHHQERAEEREAAGGSSEDVAAASVRSVRSGSAAPGEAGRQLPRTPGSPSAPGSPGALGAHPLDDLSRSSGGSPSASVAGSGVSGASVPRTPFTASAADIVGPLRDFASEVAAESAVEADEERTFRHSFGTLRPSRAEEMRTAAEYDFETALSPRASYHTRDDAFAYSHGDWMRSSEGLMGLEGAAEGAARGVGGEVEEEQEEEEGERRGAEEAEDEGEELLVYSRAQPEEGAEGEGEAEVAAEAAAQRLPPVAPLTPGTRRAALPAGPAPAGAAAGGSSGCCSDMPPGFNPAATMEGGPAGTAEDYPTIDPQSPTGHGGVDLLSYSSAPFTLHSITPPRHVMQELAASIQGQLQLRS
ncbi:hypothetical protein ABPG75_004471 [Micractinium tetrahymenae]